jgi:hypothetical protein
MSPSNTTVCRPTPPAPVWGEDVGDVHEGNLCFWNLRSSASSSTAHCGRGDYPEASKTAFKLVRHWPP